MTRLPGKEATARAATFSTSASCIRSIVGADVALIVRSIGWSRLVRSPGRRGRPGRNSRRAFTDSIGETPERSRPRTEREDIDRETQGAVAAQDGSRERSDTGEKGRERM